MADFQIEAVLNVMNRIFTALLTCAFAFGGGIMDMMADGEPFSKVALIHSLLIGKVFVEWVNPDVLKAYQWQTSAIEMSLVDMFDINNSGTRGLSEDSSCC
ncbi:hypothetical protein L1887_31881 [Cichorium endivia]|nr:hypothetical protein L1887_31881 [Cichorium endivia]